MVSAAYTYNAPDFGNSETLLGFLGIIDTGAAAKITNVHATDGVSATAGLGQVLGSVQQVRIEAGTADPIYHHSIATLTDTLAVYTAYSQMQPALSVDQIGALFVASGKSDSRLENAVDALRRVFIGSASNEEAFPCAA